MKKITLLLLLLSITFTSYAQLNEGFDTTALPTGWTVSNGGWDSGATTNGNGTVSPRTGGGMALFEINAYSGTSILSTPSQDLTSLTNPQLTFYYTSVDWFGGTDDLSIWYKESASGDWTLIQTYTAEVTDWLKVEIILPNPSADYYIGFEGDSDWARGITLDDVSVAAGPDCTPPSNLTATATSTTEVEISWVPTGT